MVNSIETLIERLSDESITIDNCEKLTNKALLLVNDTPQHLLKGKYLFQIGKAVQQRLDYRKTLPIFEGALKIFSQYDNIEGIIQCNNLLGTITKNNIGYEQSNNYFHRITTLTSKDFMANEFFNAKFHLGDNYAALGELDKALNFLFSALEYYSDIEAHFQEADVLNILFLLYINLDEPDKALNVGMKALKHCQQTPSQYKQLSKILHNFGFLYTRAKNYSLALDYYHKSLDIIEEHNITELLPLSLVNIGDNYESFGDNEKAFIYYKKAYSATDNFGNNAIRSAAIFNLAKGFLLQNNHEKASALFQDALEMVNTIKTTNLEIQFYNELKTLYFDSKNYEKAHFFQEKHFQLKERWYSYKIGEKKFNTPNIDNHNSDASEVSSEIIGNSKVISKLTETLDIISGYNVNTFITGETGTGKELFARIIHEKYKQKSPFVAINCAAIPEHLLESELFGYKRGAFTGAMREKKGIIAQANSGTLFLDEIGDLSLALQSKILRVIQEREIIPLGGTEPIPVDIRIISATNRDIKQMMKSGTFKKELFYRLNIMRIDIPPLNQRKFDIPLLVDYFIKQFNLKFGKSVKSISLTSLTTLMQYSWPGNIRELKNCIEKAVVLSSSDILQKELFKQLLIENDSSLVQNNAFSWSGFQDQKSSFINEMDSSYIINLMQASDSNISKATKLGNLGRTQIYRLLERAKLK